MTKTIYRTPEEWAQRFAVPEYHPNLEITGDYDKALAAKCSNGTFVGQLLEDGAIKVWRGIPFAKIPARFERSVPADASDRVYEALYYGKSGMQIPDESEPSSFYEQGELDVLTLTVYTGNNDIKNKPVLVYIHGGAYSCGGTTDKAYDPTALVTYNPDLLVISITSRIGILGLLDLGVKDENGNYLLSDYEENIEKYKTSNNLALLDVIQGLRWIRQNAAAFGGDVNNITISGESAGAGCVSNLLLIASDPDNKYISLDEGLFQKVFSMSGGINLYSTLENSAELTKGFIEYFGAKTIADLCKPDIDALREWLATNGLGSNFLVLDGEVLPKDLDEVYDKYSKYVGKDVKVLQGATTNEYAYFRATFKDAYEKLNFTHEDCARATFKAMTEPTLAYPDLKPTAAFKEALKAYLKALEEEGLTTEDEKLNAFLNDHTLQTINYYMAAKQAANGGTTYVYAFDEKYDGFYSDCGAGHAIDCYYLFGNFTGTKAMGTNKQVDFSRKYQNMVANFCRSADPSTEDIDWKPYNTETGWCALLNDEKIECIKGYHSERIINMIRMIDENIAMKMFLPWSKMFPIAIELHEN